MDLDRPVVVGFVLSLLYIAFRLYWIRARLLKSRRDHWTWRRRLFHLDEEPTGKPTAKRRARHAWTRDPIPPPFADVKDLDATRDFDATRDLADATEPAAERDPRADSGS